MDNLTNILWKNRWLVLALTGTGLLLGLIVPTFLSPRFKASAVVSISPKYFQHPLVRDFMSEVYDPGELRSQRDALVRQAFDQKFLDKVSADLKLIPAGETELQAAKRRQQLAQSVEVIPLQATEYQLSVISGNREDALTIIRDGIESLVDVMRAERMKVLGGLRSAVAAQIRQVLAGPRGSGNGGSSTEQRALLEDQLKEASGLYSNSHPTVRRLRARLAALERDQPGEMDLGRARDLDNAQKMAYEDLVRKLNYLNIAVEMEERQTPYYFNVVKSPELPISPIWPRRPLFLVWGFFLGFLLAIAVALGKEVGWPYLTGRAPRRLPEALAPGQAPGAGRTRPLSELIRDFDGTEGKDGIFRN